MGTRLLKLLRQDARAARLLALLVLLLGAVMVLGQVTGQEKKDSATSLRHLGAIPASSPFLGTGSPVHEPSLLAGPSTPPENLVPGVRASLLERYSRKPFAFERNLGQADSNVKFLSRGAGYALVFTRNEVAVVMRRPHAVVGHHSAKPDAEAPIPNSARDAQSFAVLRMRFVEANPVPRIVGAEPLPGKVNYFIGNDPKQWRSGIPTYAQVRYQDLYPGISVVYYGTPGRLEYDLQIDPGADPKIITLDCQGASQVKRDSQGNLRLRMSGGELLLAKPHIYQTTGTHRKTIAGGYVLKAGGQIGFQVDEYDRSQPLIVDPVLSYSTYLGGNGYDAAYGAAVDASGNAYITGFARSGNFPVTSGAYHTTCGTAGTCNGGYSDLFVTKLGPGGSTLIYSTYLGGSRDDIGKAIAVDSSGAAYITGQTFSSDFPTTAGAFQTTYGGAGDAFIVKLNSAGSSLVYSTYVGGSKSDIGNAIALDSAGNAYITGATYSTDFPSANPVQATNGGDADAFVTEINGNGSALALSTYLGGSGVDWGNAVTVPPLGDTIYVAGFTKSADFPIANPLQTCASCPTYADAFVTAINPNGALRSSTFLGGSSDDKATAIALDPAGSIYVTGFTFSTNFPTTAGAYQTSLPNGSSGAFVAKIAPNLTSLVYSTYLHGNVLDFGRAIAVDTGNVFVAGQTYSTAFPLVNTTQSACALSNCFYGTGFVTELNDAGSGLVFSTYLGGSHGEQIASIGLDSSANPYVAGETTSSNFPAVNAFQGVYGGSYGDAFVSSFSLSPAVALSPSSLAFGNQATRTTSAPQTVTLASNGTAPVHIASIATTGGFAETDNCGNGVAAGSTCTINVTFTPSGSGTSTGSLVVTDNASGSPQTVGLAGAGTSAPTPVAGVSPTGLTYASQTVGTSSAAQAATLSNTGNAALNITSIAITGTNAGDFAQTNNCGTSVAAGASCAINMTFTPSATGTRTASVTIADNALDSPEGAPLTGTGASASSSNCTKFVSPNGSDSNSGTLSSPWQHLQKAFNSSVAGDVVCLRAGAYPPQSTTTYSQIMNNSGAAGNPITIQDFPGEVAVVQGNTRINGAFVTLKGTAMTPPYGLVFQIGTSGLAIDGIDVLNTHDVTFDHVEITGFDNRAAYNQSSGCNNSVLGSYIHDNGAGTKVTGIAWGSTSTGCSNGGLIANNVIEHNSNIGIQLYAGGSSVTPSNVLLDENTIVLQGGYGIAIYGDNNVIANNVLYGNGDTLSDAQGTIDTGVANVVDHSVTFSPTSASRSGWYLAGGCCLTNNLTQDPLFVSASIKNWHLTPSSSAIGFSNANYVQPLDKDGVKRGPGYDAGAYQFVAVSLSPSSLAFATQSVGTTSSAQTVTATNNGSTALGITSISITGANASDFAQTNTCGASVSAGGTCAISVTFTPSAPGSRVASISIADNANGNPQIVSLTGLGQ